MKSRKVRIWMLANGIRGTEVARRLGVTRSTVSHFLAGRRKSQRLKDWFVREGCPERFLDERAEQ